MDSVGFDSACLTDWLLVGCFVCISVWGLWLSRRWKAEIRSRRMRSRLAGRLWIELHGQHAFGTRRKVRQKRSSQSPYFESAISKNKKVEERFIPRR